jgi:hypothetical protein
MSEKYIQMGAVAPDGTNYVGEIVFTPNEQRADRFSS